MKGLKLILSILIGIGFVYALNTKLGQLPPIGKFLNPFSGFWQNAENVNAHPILNCHGTKQEVNVLYDEQDIPHIFAANEEDLYYAQGYVVAKDRLWQMDIQTRMAEGRLSEFLGDKTLKLDREKRRIGLKYASEKAAEKFLNEETKMVMNQFTKGVNDYIHSLDYKDLPLEYKLLDYEPLDWTSERSALLLKAMAERLTGNELDVE
ncbi:MAG: penicillin acylase family protein, partial [Bacteroidetes bacterium]|nr:penicillin acylase family protein [Bacteroidota bacterium]